jgi:hypothetical protein
VNCLQLQVLDCQNCEGGGSNLQRKLIIIYRSAGKDIGRDFNVYQFCWEHTGVLPICVNVDNIKRKFLPIYFMDLGVCNTYMCNKSIN